VRSATIPSRRHRAPTRETRVRHAPVAGRLVRLSSAIALLALLVTATAGARGALRVELPDQDGSVKFLAMGDNGTGKRPQYEVAAQMVEARAQFPFEFAIMLGDNIYGGQSARDFVVKFERPYAALLEAGVKFYASLGNHDADDKGRLYAPWNMDGRSYYSFVKGFVRFFALDTVRFDEEQSSWLEQELRDSTERWKVAYFHHPIYSSARRHGSDEKLRRLMEPIFVSGGVNAVFAGHDHVYERIKPQRGIYYFVSGAAGQLRRGNLRRSTLTDAGFDQDRSFLLVEIGEDQMSVQALSRTGQTVDLVSLPRQSR